MLMHVSNGAYMDSAKLSERFIVQVRILFDCIDSIEARYIEFGDESKWAGCLEGRIDSSC
jgi:hypothetical protein